MKKIFLGFCLVTLFAITACQKEQMQVFQNASTLIPQKASLVQNSVNNQSVIIDTKKEQLAMALAKSLKNIEVRTIIKQEAMRQFDGDYDALYANIIDKKMAKGSNFEQYLSENFITTNKSSINKYKSIVESIKDLQFSVPVNCEKWNEKEQMPLVTYIPDNFDEKTTKYVRAFDSDGKVYLLSTQEEPEVPVIVVGSCERMDYVPSNSIVESIKGNLDSKTARYSGGSEYLSKIKFNNLSYFEPWLQGKPEIELRILSYTIGGTLKLWITNPKRNEVNENWRTYNTFMTYWHFSSYGDYLTWYWQEKDSGNTSTITSTNPNTGQSVSFTTTDESDDIAIETIHKNDTQTSFNGGNFQFTIYWN